MAAVSPLPERFINVQTPRPSLPLGQIPQARSRYRCGSERQHKGQVMKVAFLGLGNMGAPMGRNLLKAGHQVTVWNRTRERAREVSGAVAANTPAEAAKDTEVDVTMLADDQATETVVFGENGLLRGLPKGSIHVSSSTISVELSRRIWRAHEEGSQRYVAAPVFGRPEVAEAAKLFIVAPGRPKQCRNASHY